MIISSSSSSNSSSSSSSSSSIVIIIPRGPHDKADPALRARWPCAALVSAVHGRVCDSMRLLRDSSETIKTFKNGFKLPSMHIEVVNRQLQLHERMVRRLRRRWPLYYIILYYMMI